ncbi:MAG: hypothetical protein LAN36_11460 [Acidobacteriia bacterium]|nr:hypothetical protein [Terriglobia bacterium]
MFITIRILFGRLRRRFFPPKVSTPSVEAASLEMPATFSLSGNAGTTGVGIATVNLSGDAVASILTAPNGTYQFSNLIAGSYIVTPILAGHFFSPASRSVIVVNANIEGVDFIDPPQLSQFGLGLSLVRRNWK